MSSLEKRGMDDSDESDDDFGPAPATDFDAVRSENDSSQPLKPPLKKKKSIRRLEYESVYLDNLPLAESYERSWMHRDVVTHIAVSKPTEFIITASIDGHVKFWKKMAKTIEFAKHFQAHLGAINAMEISADGLKLVTTSQDKMIKFFEVISFDMSNMITCAYTPTAATWLSGGVRVGVADAASGAIYIYRFNDAHAVPVFEVSVHNSPVVSMRMCPGSVRVVVSIDQRGMIEYWDAETYAFPGSDKISYSMKSDTDLYDLAKAKTSPCSIVISPNGSQFVVMSKDRQIRLFDFKYLFISRMNTPTLLVCIFNQIMYIFSTYRGRTGKLRRKYDESLGTSMALTGVAADSIEQGRRAAIEKDLENTPEALLTANAAFDESGNFLIYGSLTGIKMLNLVTNRVVRTVGSSEPGERFLALALYQGIPKVDTQFLLSRAGADGKAVASSTVEEMTSEGMKNDPTIFCTSFKRRRFYAFSKRAPDESIESRDVLNEKPTEDERLSGSEGLTYLMSVYNIYRTIILLFV